MTGSVSILYFSTQRRVSSTINNSKFCSLSLADACAVGWENLVDEKESRKKNQKFSTAMSLIINWLSANGLAY